METILIVPGLRNSGPAHWQTWFEELLPGTRRVEQADWARPVLAEWGEGVAAAIGAAGEPVWIVAHSFGCLAAVEVAARRPDRVRGALLVAPANPARFGIPPERLAVRLGFPSHVVASDNDPWVGRSVAEEWARAWGSRFTSIGRAGHINVDSGHGPWPEGLGYFEQLRQSAPQPASPGRDRAPLRA